jgi:hypothetical protein
MSLQQIKIIAAIAGLYGLIGCSSIAVEEVKAALAVAKPCCATYKEIPYELLVSNQRTKSKITTKSQALDTSEGLAYFAGFKLPKDTRTIEIQALDTEPLSSSTYPDPILVILDAQYARIGEAKDLPLSRRRHVIFSGLYEYYFGATLMLPAESTYILVFARPNSSRVQSAISDNGTRWPVPSAPAGTIAIVPM